MTQVTLDPDRAARLRDQVVDQLVADGTIASKDVEAAMRKVPRHLFTPDAPLERAYDTYAAVITKVDEHGVQLSSVSAPQIQALMLEQAELGPGMRVLEIGSGGLNAAYLAELVGSGGEVTTVDIDAEVTDRAARLLGDNGYDQVRVVTADAAEPIPDLGQVDAMVVTVGAWDIPPAWMDQLKLHGRLVVPLRMRGLTRSVAFARVADHLESESAKICGFVPMQGSTAHQEEQMLVTGEPEIALRFDDGLPPEPHRLDNAVRTPRVELRTGVTIGVSELLDTLQMHLAITLPGFCTMAVDPELDTGIVAPANKGWSLAAVDGPNFAYLTHHRDEDGKHVEFAVHALGPDAPAFAEKVAGHLRGWARERRGGPCPVIRVYPAGTRTTRFSVTGSSTRSTAGSHSPGPRCNAGVPGRPAPLHRVKERHDMTNTTMALAERSAADEDDDFAPLDIRIVIATHPHGKLMCATGDGCGQTCANGASACSSFIEDPA